jgi:phenylacetate-CoA ligase
MRYFNEQLETMSRERLSSLQSDRLRVLLAELDGKNPFYTKRLRDLGAEAADFTVLESLQRFPFTTKQELTDDQDTNRPFGTNLTYPESAYTRYHQTSGTTGRPLKVLDTQQDWDWWGRCWGHVLAGAGISEQDRLFVAFSFGPFIGFWAAVEGARHINAMMISGGGRDSLQRLELMRETNCTALISTPTYALHLVEVAREADFDLRSLNLRATIHAGEPGASLPSTKRRIEEAWSVKCYDHAGATEVGAHSFECELQPGSTHINEAEFIAEMIDPDTLETLPAGRRGELVLTNLGRFGFPVIRYRTGDIVELVDDQCDCGRSFIRCRGGIIGRTDDMVTVRGVNVYPSAIENLIRAVPAVSEFRVTITRQGELDQMRIEIECVGDSNPSRIADTISASITNLLGLKPTVEPVSPNTLPRFELKAKRFHVKR